MKATRGLTQVGGEETYVKRMTVVAWYGRSHHKSKAEAAKTGDGPESTLDGPMPVSSKSQSEAILRLRVRGWTSGDTVPISVC